MPLATGARCNLFFCAIASRTRADYPLWVKQTFPRGPPNPFYLIVGDQIILHVPLAANERAQSY